MSAQSEVQSKFDPDKPSPNSSVFKCTYTYSIFNFFLEFQTSIVPLIYENIEIKVSQNLSESELMKSRVSNFMEFIKLEGVVEELKIRPR